MTSQQIGITQAPTNRMSAAAVDLYHAARAWIARLRDALSDKRRVMRILDPPLGVCYSTGGPALYRTFRDVSAWGAFILTDEDWFPGTVIYLMLEQQIEGNEHYQAPSGSFGVWAKVVRRSPQGLGVTFLFANKRERPRLRRFLENTLREALLARVARGIPTDGAAEAGQSPEADGSPQT